MEKMALKEDYACIQEIIKKNGACSQKLCKHHFDSEENHNCSMLAAAVNGPCTLQEIGDHFGLSRMRICQIEKNIINKLKLKLEKFEF